MAIIEGGSASWLGHNQIHTLFKTHYPIHINSKMKYAEIIHAREWCIENFGPSARVIHDPIRIDTSHNWLNFARHFYFRDPDWAVMFRMMWG